MIKLRPYSPSDLNELYQLFYDTVHRVNSRDYNPQQIAVWAPREPLQSLVGELESNFTRIATLDDQIVGFVELTPHGLVKGLFTHHQMQGRGVGKLLLEAVIDEAKRTGIKELYLESSLTARSFYEKMGFVVKEEKTKDLRGERFDIITMNLRL